MATSNGRSWLITGVSSGLGRALALAALAAGDRVVGSVRAEIDRERFEAEVPGRSSSILLDVTDEDAVRYEVARAEAETGGIDILVSNAGYGLVGAVEEASLDEIRRQFEVNVFGAVAVIQAALPFMRRRRAGHILVTSSVSGLVGWPSLGLYSGSKFALEGIGETLALEVAPLGIKVTLIEPGGFRTDFAGRSRVQTQKRIDDYDATVGQSRRLLEEHAGQEPGDPVQAAAAILAIAGAPSAPLRLLLGSDALAYATGKLSTQLSEIEASAELSQSTDFPSRVV